MSIEPTQADRMLVEAIINDYHTTRLDSDYVSHILSKPRTQAALARHRLASTPASGEGVAWMYERNGKVRISHGERSEDMLPAWTETPLYAAPSHPAADLVEALEAVIAATCAYLPPDGISKHECINRVLAATDNPRINAALSRYAKGGA